MNDTTEPRPLTPDEEATGKAVTASIDILVDLCVEMGMAASTQEGEEADDDAAATTLVIAEGVLARILSAYCRAHQNAEMPLEERDQRAQELLLISAKHVADVFAHYWAALRVAAEPDEV